MSEEGSSEICVGFFMTLEEALKPFLVTQDEISHLEDRFDPKTGKKIEPVKVVDREKGVYAKLPNSVELLVKDDDMPEEFLKFLRETLGILNITSFGGGDCTFIGFDVARANDYEDDTSYDPSCHFSVGGSLKFTRVLEMIRPLSDLGKKLKDLGYEVGQPCIFSAVLIY